ncbi:MAG: hypothetical protein IJT54_06010 [Candidatus Methanomethylophilaceae archaeon]|nr:hypothetical protein [Candidatus Methanomethylophilaceae archaeon]
MDKKKARMKKSIHRERVIVDTNVISSVLKNGNRLLRIAFNYILRREDYVYTDSIDLELSNYPVDDKKGIKAKIEAFRSKYKGSIQKTPIPDDDKLKKDKYPAKGKDRRILYEAEKFGVDVIVTLDKVFRKRANGFKGIRVIRPIEYMKRRKYIRIRRRDRK